MKIKIIDLVARWLNADEMPKKIKYDGLIFEYDPLANDYMTEESYLGLLDRVAAFSDFNDEVEIIEEPKKIEKIGEKPDTILYEFNDYVGTLEDALDWNFKVIEDKINVLSDALIDVVNKLKED